MTVPSEGQEYEKLILAAKESATTVHAEKAVQRAGAKKGRGVALSQTEVTFIHLGIQLSRDQ